jgi:hypothetical protein
MMATPPDLVPEEDCRRSPGEVLRVIAAPVFTFIPGGPPLSSRRRRLHTQATWNTALVLVFMVFAGLVARGIAGRGPLEVLVTFALTGGALKLIQVRFPVPPPAAGEPKKPVPVTVHLSRPAAAPAPATTNGPGTRPASARQEGQRA